MKRIQRASRAVKLLAVALLWFYAIVMVAMVIAMLVSSSSPIFESIFVVSTYGSGLLVMAMCHHVARLAAVYERGELFTAQSVHHLRWVGLLALVMAVLPHLAFDGHHWSASVQVEVSGVLVALVLIFSSWVTDEARKLREEQDLVI
ncbi:MAG: DUF2975 domain-containing protein [Deltaproteobacteria bacterium]|nr:DUF2975 domain-containing protein [Deltaproteobacteria bacterium]